MGFEGPLLRLAADELIGMTMDAIVDEMVRSPQEVLMPARAHIVHHIPGRVRLRIPKRRDDREFFADVERRLSGCDNITGVSANPTTASVLVRYEGELAPVLLQAAQVGLAELLELTEDLPPVKPVEDALLDTLSQADSRILSISSGAMNGRSAVLVSLLVAGLFQLWRGQLLGPAIPLLWYAAQALGLGAGRRPESAPGRAIAAQPG
jgi:hypothetical protein